MYRNPLLSLVFLSALVVACTPQDDADSEGDGTDGTDTEGTDGTDADTDGTTEAEPELTLQGSQQDDDLTVELLTEGPLQVGWNPVYFRLTAGTENTPVTAATITQSPLMQMTDMAHACPFSDPSGDADANGLFAGELVFIMASGGMGTWSDTVAVQVDGDDDPHEVTFDDLSVAETGRKKDLQVGEEKYLVTLTPRGDLHTGEVPYVLTVHRKASMMDFPPVEDLTLVATPFMPDMGHGSEGNIDPEYMENGRYEGTAVFSMGGAWTLTVAVKRGEETLGEVVFDLDV